MARRSRRVLDLILDVLEQKLTGAPHRECPPIAAGLLRFDLSRLAVYTT
jgi:hypothetical protein